MHHSDPERTNKGNNDNNDSDDDDDDEDINDRDEQFQVEDEIKSFNNGAKVDFVPEKIERVPKVNGSTQKEFPVEKMVVEDMDVEEL